MTSLLLVISFPNISNAQGFLKTSGTEIVDGAGNEIHLRGINLGNWLEPEGYMWQTSDFANSPTQIQDLIDGTVGQQAGNAFWNLYRHNYITKTDIDSIASWGFNSVRLPMHYEFFTPKDSPYVYIWDGFNIVDSLLSWCAMDHVYLILDLHCAPGGQNSDNISDYSGPPSLWQDTSYQNRTVDLWRRIAEHYANAQWIGGYDILNETAWNFNGDTQLFRNFLASITTAIREVDKNHIVFIEGNWYATDFTGLTPPWDNNMAYSFHKYGNTNDLSSIQGYLTLRNTYNIPLWCGETGENTNPWLTGCVRLLAAADIGWCMWPFKKIQSVSCPASINETADFKSLLNYWNQGTNPPQQFAVNALNELTDNLKLLNCAIHPDVMDALFREVNATSSIPFPYANNVIPGVINADNYDMGPAGIAYLDSDLANNGGAYRNDAVDIEQTTDTASETNGFDVGWILSGEFLTYTVDATDSGTYDIETRIAAASAGGQIQFLLDGKGLGGVINIPSTGNWQSWRSVLLSGVKILVGVHTLEAYFLTGNFNLDYFKFTSKDNGGGTASSFTTTQNYPNPFNSRTRINFHIMADGHVKVEMFDLLGKRVATLMDENKSSGDDFVDINGQALGLASGVYIVRLTYRSNMRNIKSVYLK
ncbi:MAG TPA: cellulase family glycosylhydrolase [Candidatus Acidoferrales bacterium]|nr:cellulase family glycosylhydrolase [Candidatus Acidoferrales bacterium]